MMQKSGWCGKVKYAEHTVSSIGNSQKRKPSCPCSCSCPGCGCELQGSSKFCSECGYKLK